MTTTAEKIRQIAALYPEPRAMGDVALSEMDFLALQALEGNPDACRMIPGAGFVEEARCHEERRAALAADPDGFIARHLGARGEAFRQYHERKARALSEAAKRYAASDEPDSLDSSFQRERDEVESHFDRVLQAYGRHVFDSPFRQSFTLREILLIVLDAVK